MHGSRYTLYGAEISYFSGFEDHERACANRLLERVQGGLTALLQFSDLPRLDRHGLSVVAVS